MKVKISKSYLYGKIQCPPSKTYSHRAVILAGLSNGVSKIENVLLSRDTLATINCSKMLGIEFEKLEKKNDQNTNEASSSITNTITYTTNNNNSSINLNESSNSANLKVMSPGGKEGFKTPDDVLNAENSGTTIRLLTTMCSLVTSGYSILTGDKSLRKRPMGDLLKALSNLGVHCFSSNSYGFAPLVIKGGGIPGGKARISGKVSSQFISSILLSGIYSKRPIIIEVIGEQVSKPYIESTIAIMKKFGVSLENEKVRPKNPEFREKDQYNLDSHSDHKNLVTQIYNIPFQIEYKPSFIKIPGDFSTAALLMSAAVLSDGELTIENLDFSMPQGDNEIVNLIKLMGGDITVDKNQGLVKINGNKLLDGGEFDLRNTPDLLPVVSILALKSTKVTTINGISHARYKETDRVSNIASQLVKFGAKVKEKEDQIVIEPPFQIKVNAPVESFNDHRLFMAFAIASLATDNSIIEGAESVDVSYPSFISDLKKLGANIQYL